MLYCISDYEGILLHMISTPAPHIMFVCGVREERRRFGRRKQRTIMPTQPQTAYLGATTETSGWRLVVRDGRQSVTN